MQASETGLLPLARRRWRLIAAATVVCALVGLIVALTIPKTYEARTNLLVGPVNADYGTLQAAGQLGRTYAELARSEKLVGSAARAAGVKLSPPEAAKQVASTSNEITRVVDIRVRNENPRTAARMANAIAAGLIELRRNLPPQDSEPVDELMREGELVRLTAAQRADVRHAAERVLARTNAGLLQVVDGADVPATPVSPRLGLIVLLAALAGGLGALAFAIVTDAPRREPMLDELDLTEVLDGYTAADAESRSVDEWLESRLRAESS